MFATINDTTVVKGQSQATIIKDSTHDGHRITTVELLYPRYIHSELLTHRVFSRNSSSSRATPIDVLVASARDPVFFDEVLMNKPGMQGAEPLTPEQLADFKNDWHQLANYVADWVQTASVKYNIHKQTLNRALEPFTKIRTLVTATDWDNFFKLRISDDAQPEIRNLALAIKEAMMKSEPKHRDIHAPYVDDPTTIDDDAIKSSVARCARVSYGRLNAKPNNLADDIRLYNMLKESHHMSPFEHVAVFDLGQHANFNGWKSLRCSIE